MEQRWEENQKLKTKNWVASITSCWQRWMQNLNQALFPQSEAISRPSPKSYRHRSICAGASPSCSAHRGASLRCLVHAAVPLECAAHCVPHSLSDEEPAPLRCGPGASPSISHTRFLAPVGLCLPVNDVRAWEPFFPTICIICALFSSFWPCQKQVKEIGSEKSAPQCSFGRGGGIVGQSYSSQAGVLNAQPVFESAHFSSQTLFCHLQGGLTWESAHLSPQSHFRHSQGGSHEKVLIYRHRLRH